jgi:hypothetical protein
MLSTFDSSLHFIAILVGLMALTTVAAYIFDRVGVM